MEQKVTDFKLYRWRYRIGYLSICIAGLSLLAMALFLTPNGLTQNEMNSVVTTNSASFKTIDAKFVVNAPYHFLQWMSLRTFGLNDFAIKLPSVILAIATTVGVFWLLRYWFRRNVAVITTIIVVTTGQFLFVAQNGTPLIMPMFWAVWILLSTLLVSRSMKLSALWKIMMFGFASLSLYTPLSFYMLLAIASAGLLHPHLRYIIRQMPTIKVVIAMALSVCLLAPLGYAISVNPGLIQQLLGIPSSMPNIVDNLMQLAKNYIDFVNPSSGHMMTPIYGLGSILLMVLGMIQLFTTKYTARGYILSAWLILLIPIIVFNPQAVSTTFVPLVILVAMGVELLLQRWYGLFPFNPYARLAGLVPLAILIGSMTISGIARYFDSYTHDPTTSSYYTQDLQLVNHQLSEQKSDLLLIVPKDDIAFYTVFGKYNPSVKVSDQVPDTISQPTLVSGKISERPQSEKISKILTSPHLRNSDRFYLYQK